MLITEKNLKKLFPLKEVICSNGYISDGHIVFHKSLCDSGVLSLINRASKLEEGEELFENGITYKFLEDINFNKILPKISDMELSFSMSSFIYDNGENTCRIFKGVNKDGEKLLAIIGNKIIIDILKYTPMNDSNLLFLNGRYTSVFSTIINNIMFHTSIMVHHDGSTILFGIMPFRPNIIPSELKYFIQ